MPARFDSLLPYHARLSPEERDLIAELTHPATPPPQRFTAGHRLSRLGDKRPGVGVHLDGTPDIEWVEIPGGEFVYQDGQTYTSLPTFYMARYPITVGQYATFMADGGYPSRDFWTREGWLWRADKHAPMLWTSPRWSIPNHPVVGVTWYEAMAFCAWLARRLGVDADVLRLPTEYEWEKAARGQNGNLFPWGRVCYSGYANINETYAYYHVGEYFLKRTTAVGAYPADCSPYGVMDMAGNVREWTFSPHYDIGRVLRGGGWFSNSFQAQTIYRNWFYAYNADHGIGFRPVLMLNPTRAGVN